MQNTIKGKPIQIIQFSSEHRIEFKEEELKKILDQDDVRDRKIVVMSVAGKARLGKSTLLNYMLRYWEYTCVRKEDWLRSGSQPLKGFSWCGGSTPITNGIVVWSEVLKLELETGEKIAILLMDTQGVDALNATDTECTTVFALGSLLSSVQIYLLPQEIRKGDVQNLKFYSEYANLANDENHNKHKKSIFQRLIFFIRDWQNPSVSGYGLEGGKSYLQNQVCASIPRLKEYMTEISDTLCFLSPHPGSKIIETEFYGQTDLLDDIYKEHLNKFLSMLFSQDNLVIKECSGKNITAAELIQYFGSCSRNFQDSPTVQNHFAATVEAHNLIEIERSLKHYKAMMKSFENVNSYVPRDELATKHEDCCKEILQYFQNSKRMGGNRYGREYQSQLQRKLQEEFQKYVAINESRFTRWLSIKAFFSKICDSIRAFVVKTGASIKACIVKIWATIKKHPRVCYCIIAVFILWLLLPFLHLLVTNFILPYLQPFLFFIRNNVQFDVIRPHIESLINMVFRTLIETLNMPQIDFVTVQAFILNLLQRIFYNLPNHIPYGFIRPLTA